MPASFSLPHTVLALAAVPGRSAAPGTRASSAAVRLPPRASWAAPVVARAALLAGPGLSDGQGPSPLRRAMEPGNGGLGFCVVRHLDKAKASGASGLALPQNLDSVHGAIGGEELLEVVFSGLPIQITDKDRHASVLRVRWCVMGQRHYTAHALPAALGHTAACPGRYRPGSCRHPAGCASPPASIPP